MQIDGSSLPNYLVLKVSNCNKQLQKANCALPFGWFMWRVVLLEAENESTAWSRFSQVTCCRNFRIRDCRLVRWELPRSPFHFSAIISIRLKRTDRETMIAPNFLRFRRIMSADLRKISRKLKVTIWLACFAHSLSEEVLARSDHLARINFMRRSPRIYHLSHGVRTEQGLISSMNQPKGRSIESWSSEFPIRWHRACNSVLNRLAHPWNPLFVRLQTKY